MDDSQDGRARLLELEEKLRKAAEENSLLAAENNSLTTKNSSLVAEHNSLAAENKSLAEKNRQDDELLRSTTFTEYIRHCHESLSKPLRVASLSACVKGPLQAPTHKSCPRLLKHWTECEDEQENIYRSVCKFLEQKRLLERIVVIQGNGKQVEKDAIGSEKDLEIYERSSVENHVAHIIAALCEIPAAQETFHLGSKGISFKNHSESL
ncbi:uncharacterized protein LDX57_009506 [Aspergillus melleus]|uniref:uncharacterized protein n=1 Tax=Aspergillus melleus TaxID=138277 RepID=UPI001E8E7547|nr:uncharacterized protein LDX57_009506 [Aspergillus melleus]KAH8431855.1 hypothetical protein LDX57_009506 [Aspergillus melleus]